jgi:RNA polymerase sigma factor (sigma-70 family)
MKSFFEEHIWPKKGQLYRLVYLWVRDRAVAEDVLQNVFEKSVGKETELKSHPNLSGWLVKSLKNEVLMHFRISNRLQTLEGLEEIPMDESIPEDTKDSVAKVMNLLKGLPVKQQEVFQLREVEGLSYSEIADYLLISEDQVKVNLYRSRKWIREKLTNQKMTK